MCGIVGQYSHNSHIDAAKLSNSLNTIKHRGPDDEGIWINNLENLALGHRRLSILDLASHAKQPMLSPSGRFILAFNGEIYNYAELRNLLSSKGCSFKTQSDTEVLAASIETWGVEEACKRAVGMFAFAAWDTQEQILHLARDRFGEKPLYLFERNQEIIFSSDLAAIKQLVSQTLKINEQAVYSYFSYGYIPSPLSIYENITKLMPGYISSYHSGRLIKRVQYWSAIKTASASIARRCDNVTEALELVDNQIKKSIKQQMLASDVPIGAFLSGGIDSSIITAIMQNESSTPIKTFTIGMQNSSLDESKHAEMVANYLKTDHMTLSISPNDILEQIPLIPSIYSEPFADSSQIPTYLVSKLAKKHVTVALSGDGGDELFGGYNRHFVAPKLLKKLELLPLALRKPLSQILNQIPISAWAKASSILQLRDRTSNPANKIQKTLSCLNVTSEFEMYRKLLGTGAESLLSGSFENSSCMTDLNHLFNTFSFSEAMMLADTLFYLPNDILTKVDRASMASSLESRAPFLDHNLFSIAWRLPLNMKINNNEGKLILKQLLNKYLPKQLYDRPKSGFAIPLADWLKVELRDWVESLITMDKLNQHGFFNAKSVRKLWKQHLSGKVDAHQQLWCLIMFQAWQEKQ